MISAILGLNRLWLVGGLLTILAASHGYMWISGYGTAIERLNVKTLKNQIEQLELDNERSQLDLAELERLREDVTELEKEAVRAGDDTIVFDLPDIRVFNAID